MFARQVWLCLCVCVSKSGGPFQTDGLFSCDFSLDQPKQVSTHTHTHRMGRIGDALRALHGAAHPRGHGASGAGHQDL